MYEFCTVYATIRLYHVLEYARDKSVVAFVVIITAWMWYGFIQFSVFRTGGTCNGGGGMRRRRCKVVLSVLKELLERDPTDIGIVRTE